MPLALLATILTLLVPTTAALPIGPGVLIGDGSTTILIDTPTSIEVGSLTFDSTNAPILGDVTLDLNSTPPTTWRLLEHGPTTLRLQGTPSEPTAWRVAGLVGEWNVNGVPGTGDFAITGSGTWTSPPGAQLVVLSARTTGPITPGWGSSAPLAPPPAASAAAFVPSTSPSSLSAGLALPALLGVILLVAYVRHPHHVLIAALVVTAAYVLLNP